MQEVFSWDSKVDTTIDKPEYEPLAAGVYNFTVSKFERKRFNGSAKMKACPMAELQLTCTNEAQEGTVFVRLYLCKQQVWKITHLFRSCALIPEEGNENADFPWDKIVGARGMVKVKQREYNGKIYNDVDEFLSVQEQAHINVEKTKAQVQDAHPEYDDIEF